MVACATAWWPVSCRDVGTPSDGVFQLSALQLPLPGVVAGDTMRDSSGSVAPLRVTAFTRGGDTIKNAVITFIALDSGAHLAGALLIGDSAGKTVRIVGSSGAVQTRLDSVKVTVSPDTLVAADTTLFQKAFSLTSGDTDVKSPELATLVKHTAAPAAPGVPAVIVRYSIVRAPPGNGPTIVLMNGSADTSKASGRATKTARLRLLAISNTMADTAVIRATASYRHSVLGVVTFMVIFKSQ